jgi:hypothetical protein
MASDWYYISKGRQCGPVTSNKLRELAELGYLQPNDLVWKDGMREWSPASKVKGLFRTPPVPAPPPLPEPPRQAVPVVVNQEVPIRVVVSKEGIAEKVAKWVVIGWSAFCLMGVVGGVFRVAASSPPSDGDQYTEAGQVIGIGCGLAIWLVYWAAIAMPSLVIWLLVRKK